MKVIHKFFAPYLNSRCTYNLSPDYKVMSVGLDPVGRVCMWIMIDPSKIPTIVEFKNIGTGCQDPKMDEYEFLGSVTSEPYVHHLFKVNKQ